ncbi:MAG: multidrug efflux SMR transporter [Ignavibacteriales bacterium]|jgi:quaternary ammonium compound-resistance protein SugE|nr:multidrug efflux SMR transporter [Ignavibacteriaceae bacterium]NLH61216.1 multidrug efflux SMR transporter [Ignavibacteriales bacterium]HOJ19102.1 multidrug efflux SMR transporter [Ignavibacteriaceae bacterium]HPO54621.1 multidrug efflux SMR transporter [Ignavibacteriaceae bacterium]
MKYPVLNTNTAWLLLFIAGLFEAGWVIGMKYSDGFTRIIPSIITVICMVISMLLLSYAVRTLPIGTGYAVWTGIGVIASVILGIILFKEEKDFLRLFFITLIMIGITGLKVVTK